MDLDPEIRDATVDDAETIARIYNYYIAHTVVSFEIDEVTADEIVTRMTSVQESLLPWLVLERSDDPDTGQGSANAERFDDNGRILGYAYARPWNPRGAYRYSVESSVYLDHRQTRRGSGSRLYRALIDRLQTRGIHSVIGGITLPNDASVALHEKFGFRKSAHYREVGFKQDRWIDVGYWQCILT